MEYVATATPGRLLNDVAHVDSPCPRSESLVAAQHEAARLGRRRTGDAEEALFEVPELRYGETGAVNDTAYEQLTVIKAVTGTLETAGISAWLFGGWGLDARIGRITRDHGDVEFWVERVDAERSKTALVTAGATALTTQPPTESCEFTWDGTDFSTAYFDRQPDGAFSQPDGRFSDWLFPPGSFVKEAVTLDSVHVLAMSAEGMLAMKEQYPKLRNGHPWRPKDIADIETLKAMVADNDGYQGAPPHGSVRRT